MRKILVVFLFCLCLSGVKAQNSRPSVALILGGGGARGFAHAAVLELIDEMGIPVDFIAGVSSGAIVGGLYSIGYSPAMIMEVLENNDWSSFFQDRPASPFLNTNKGLPFSFSLGSSAGAIAPHWGLGYSSGQKVYEFFKSLTVKIPSNTMFDDLPVPFRAGAAEIPSGKFELLGEGDLAEAIRASMSIQGVFEPFMIEGRRYIDGGFINNLPVREVRELGYDIVIAVDLFIPPEEYSVALLDLPDLMNILYSRSMSVDQHAFADAVLFPLPAEVSSTNFENSREIYEMVRAQKEKLKALLEPVKEKISSGRSGLTAAKTAYSELEPAVPRNLIIKGALSRDIPHIRRMFSRHIMVKALEEENLNAFLDSVYATGNYLAVLARTDSNAGDASLELILRPAEENKIFVRGGLDYEGTFSSDSSHRAALRGGVEFRGKTGSSVLIKASILDELSIGLSLFKPLGPRFFLSADSALVRDQKLKIKGVIDSDNTITDRLLYFTGNVSAGILFNEHNSFSFRPEYFWWRDEGSYFSMAGLGAAYTYTRLNHSLFPTRGFRLGLENSLRFAPGKGTPFDLAGIDLTAAVPLGPYFSIGLSGFGSSFFGETDLPDRLSTFTVNNPDRIYFPHKDGIFSGNSRAALSLSFQFEPIQPLTLFGGRLVFLLEVSAGGPFEWENDSWKDRLIWNASAGAALLPGKAFGILLRAGAGGGNGAAALPFISLDLGMSGFQKNQF